MGVCGDFSGIKEIAGGGIDGAGEGSRTCENPAILFVTTQRMVAGLSILCGPVQILGTI
jgi:hypothetical protein